MLRVAVVGLTTLAVVVISIVAIVVSTTKGSEWSETVWKSTGQDPDKDPDKDPEQL